MTKKASGQLAREAHQVGENLRAPLENLVSTALEKSYDVAESVTVSAFDFIGAVFDEADRLRDKIRRGLDAAAK